MVAKRVKPVHAAGEVESARAARGDVDSVKIGKRSLEAGDIITIFDARGEFIFTGARVVDGKCEWFNAYSKNGGGLYSFPPERLKSKKRVAK